MITPAPARMGNEESATISFEALRYAQELMEADILDHHKRIADAIERGGSNLETLVHKLRIKEQYSRELASELVRIRATRKA